MGSIGKVEGMSVPISRLGSIVSGVPHNIGSGFSAKHFSEEMFEGRMDPLLMVDHFVMTAPTFDPHLHAGISAVTAMFEDSEGSFFNRDSLGQSLELKAGDLYWLAAASGAVHEEKPGDGARVHALQVFVNLPERLKKCPARALKVEAQTIPVIEGDGHRVRVVLGQSGTVVGTSDTPEEMTLLDGSLEERGRFSHELPEGRQAWIYAVAGSILVTCEGDERRVPAGSATTVLAGPAADVSIETNVASHFVMMAGKPIHEVFVKAGPLVMSTASDVRETLASYAEGKFGHISA